MIARAGWIESRGRDLVWYALAPLAGLLYVALLAATVSSPDQIFTRSLVTVPLGVGAPLVLTVSAFVFLSYSWIFDGTHSFATLARLLSHPDERRRYARPLRRSFVFFLAGPALVLAGRAAELSGRAPAGLTLHVATALIVAFQVWGLWHILRQHWGFTAIYRAKLDERDVFGLRLDQLALYTSVFAPLLAFVVSPAFESLPGVPRLGLAEISIAGFRPAAAIGVGARAAFVAVLAIYVLHVAHSARRGRPLNLPKLLTVGSVAIVSAVTFSDARFAACMTPILGLGHNLQYHRIVWTYESRRAGKGGPRARVFAHPAIYFGLMLACTWLLYRGPISEWLFGALAGGAGPRSMLDAMQDPSRLTLSQQLLGVFLMGFGAQHYYLDGHIWRLRRDDNVRRHLSQAGETVKTGNTTEAGETNAVVAA